LRCCSSSTRSSCSSSERRRLAARGAALAATAIVLIGGCGEDSDTVGGDHVNRPAPSPLAAIAVPGPIETIDPVYADSPGERLISRQVHEPLTSRIDPPFAESGRRRGPARPLDGDAGRRLWRFELRPGVLFQDGTQLNADAVIANVDRWTRTGIAAQLIPELIAVDSPRPGEVRFQLAAPVPDLPARLADARLGLVSRAALEGRGGRPIRFGSTGSGPYELRERDGRGMLLVRSERWWGRAAGLGPGINQLDFALVDDELERAGELIEGEVAMATELGTAATQLLGGEPLVRTLGDPPGAVGISAALRGLTSPRPDQSLSGLWSTELR
jgi:peptide/nickel transport system substrate-binding protein